MCLDKVRRKLEPVTSPLKKLYYDLKWTREEHPLWLLLVILSPLVGVIIGIATVGQSPLGAEYPAARSLFRALISAQTSILAIVFSVGLVILQLLAQRYSQGVLRLLIRFPLFHVIFWLFIVSISANMWLLYNLPADVNSIGAVLSVGAAVLSIVAISSIILVVREGVYLSEPSQAAVAYLDTLQREQHLQNDFEALDHPLDPIHEQLRTEISNNRYAPADRIAKNYFQFCQDNHHYTNVNLYEEKFGHSKPFFDKVLREHLPEAAQAALKHEEYNLAKDILQYQYQLTTYGFRSRGNKLVYSGFSGFQSFLLQEDISKENSVYRKAVLYSCLIITGYYNNSEQESDENMAERYREIVSSWSYPNLVSQFDSLPIRELLSSQEIILKNHIHHDILSWGIIWQLERDIIVSLFTDKGINEDVRPLIQEHFTRVYSILYKSGKDYMPYDIFVDILQIGMCDGLLKSTDEYNKGEKIHLEAADDIGEKFIKQGWHDLIADLMQKSNKFQILEYFEMLTRDIEVDVDIEYGTGESTEYIAEGPEINRKNVFSELGFHIDLLMFLDRPLEFISEYSYDKFVSKRISDPYVQKSLINAELGDQINKLESIDDEWDVFDILITDTSGEQILVRFDPEPRFSELHLSDSIRNKQWSDMSIIIFSLDNDSYSDIDKFDNMLIREINKDIVE